MHIKLKLEATYSLLLSFYLHLGRAMSLAATLLSLNNWYSCWNEFSPTFAAVKHSV